MSELPSREEAGGFALVWLISCVMATGGGWGLLFFIGLSALGLYGGWHLLRPHLGLLTVLLVEGIALAALFLWAWS